MKEVEAFDQPEPASNAGNPGGSRMVKVTVCELRNDPAGLEEDWGELVRQVQAEGSGLVLLPEMPFAPWVAGRPSFEAGAWQAFCRAHDGWMGRLGELAPAAVMGTRPVERSGRRLNEAFVWDATGGYRPAHHKVYLPDEPGFWEASWYGRGDKEFSPAGTGLGDAGFLICTEMWFTAHAIDYARAGVTWLAVPRATPGYSVEKWLAGGTAAAVMSGAICLSSNRGGVDPDGAAWGGAGWVIEPEGGRLLAQTSRQEPIVTVEVDVGVAEQAKRTYPRYIYV